MNDMKLNSIVEKMDIEVIPILVDALITRLDEVDGDCDLEDDDPDQCMAGDDGFHPMVIWGKTFWGPPEQHT